MGFKRDEGKKYVCKICGTLEDNTPKFYYQKELCNKHYIQIYRHGKIIDKNISSDNSIDKQICDICGDNKSNNYKRWHGEDQYKNMILCTKHYSQIRNGRLLDEFPSQKNRSRVCEYCGKTDGEIIYCRKTNQMLCRKHYDHIYNYDKILEITVFDKNKYEEKDKCIEVILRGKDNLEKARTIIDREDLNRVLEYKWNLGTWGYANTNINGEFVMLQNFILEKDGMIDHINRNPLDNRKCNLIESNKSLNALNCDVRPNNTSGVTGVSFSNRLNKWRSYINWEGKRIELGYFNSMDDAIKTRLKKEYELLKELAPQKHLFEKYNIKEGL